LLAVVTGASAGIGRATALEFARRGCDVALLARNATRLDAAAEEVCGQGTEALPIATDVADADAVDAAATRIEAELGPINVWVNNAMATIFAPIDRVTPEEFRRATEVTYFGQVYGTMTALSRMRRVIVAPSSMWAQRSPIGRSRCNRSIAEPNTQCEALPTPSVRS
jgi:NAD(P)-dependent dehydrogenase (short-subunit alcohol dehydrogenase family)